LQVDLDLGASGAIVLKDKYIITGGKQGPIYIADASNLGGYQPTQNNANVFQVIATLDPFHLASQRNLRGPQPWPLQPTLIAPDHVSICNYVQKGNYFALQQDWVIQCFMLTLQFMCKHASELQRIRWMCCVPGDQPHNPGVQQPHGEDHLLGTCHLGAHRWHLPGLHPRPPCPALPLQVPPINIL